MTHSASLAEAIRIDGCQEVVRHRSKRHEWLLRADCAHLILGPGSPDWTRLSACPTAELVKGNRNRQVWRVQVDGQLLYVKVYENASAAGRIKNLLRGSPAWSEWRSGVYAARIGLPSVAPLACAQPVRPLSGAPCLLITQGVRHAVPLDRYWLSVREDHQAVAELTEALASTIARAHQGGFEHDDLHVGNLLVQRDPNARLRILLVDLHSVRFGRPVGDAAVVRNLAQLNQWFRRHASLTRRLAFLKSYLCWHGLLVADAAYGRPLGHDLRSLAGALEKAADRHAAALWAKRDRRALREGKYFGRIGLRGGWRGQVFLEAKHPLPGSPSSTCRFRAADWSDWLGALLGRLRREPELGLIKCSHSARVRRLTLSQRLGGLEVVCKQSLYRTPLRRLTGLLRRSRDLRAWQRGYALLNRDLPTVRPLAVLERRTLGLLRESLVVTEVIPDHQSLDRIAGALLPGLSGAARRRIKDLLMESLVGLLKRLHERGFAHRDFKAGNVLITGLNGDLRGLRVWLIDLDGLRRPRRLRQRDRLRALMRLSVSLEECPAVTRTDRLRFLRRFMLGFGQGDAGWKEVWRRLQTWSHKKRRHKALRTAWKLRHYGRT